MSVDAELAEWTEVSPVAGSNSTGIYAAQCLAPRICNDILQECGDSEAWRVAQVNSMAMKSGVVLRSAQSIKIDSVPSATEAANCISQIVLRKIRSNYTQDELILGKPQLIRYRAGDFVRLHADAGSNEESRLISAITYINDGFEGGGTDFPMQDVLIQPKAGKTVIFPSEYIHQSFEIEKGRKYILLFFFHSTP